MGLYHDAEVDMLIDRAAVMVDLSQRRVVLTRIQRILTLTDPAAVYVAEEANSTTYRRALHGYMYNTVDVLSYDYYSMWK